MAVFEKNAGSGGELAGCSLGLGAGGVGAVLIASS